MVDDYFDVKIALSPDTGSPVPGAVAQVFAPSDIGFTTPLPITDLGGLPMSTLKASPTGIYPAFRCPGYTQVIAKSGSMYTPITSLLGALLDVLPNPSSVGSTPMALVAEQGQYRLVPRSTAQGNPPDPSLASSGTVLTIVNGQMQWVLPAPTISGAPDKWPTAFPPALHTHSSGEITDSSAIGRAVLTAASAQAARQAIGAGTGNGTSDLKLGTTADTAAAGNHTHQASGIPFTPAGPISATDVQQAILQAASMGSGSGTSQVQVLRFASGQYPAFPATKPAGVVMFVLIGPVVPTTGNVSGGIPSYVGNGSSQIPAEYRVNSGLS